jgi:hypothetical protein
MARQMRVWVSGRLTGVKKAGWKSGEWQPSSHPTQPAYEANVPHRLTSQTAKPAMHRAMMLASHIAIKTARFSSSQAVRQPVILAARQPTSWLSRQPDNQSCMQAAW